MLNCGAQYVLSALLTAQEVPQRVRGDRGLKEELGRGEREARVCAPESPICDRVPSDVGPHRNAVGVGQKSSTP
jgi:hypothetical protein